MGFFMFKGVQIGFLFGFASQTKGLLHPHTDFANEQSIAKLKV